MKMDLQPIVARVLIGTGANEDLRVLAEVVEQMERRPEIYQRVAAAVSRTFPESPFMRGEGATVSGLRKYLQERIASYGDASPTELLINETLAKRRARR